VTPESLPPAEYVMYVLGGKGRAAAVSTAAAWRLADRLAESARPIEQLAVEVGCPVDALAAVLRVCAGLGFFSSPQPGVFAVTERGKALSADSLGPMAAFVGASEQWDPWSRLRSVQGRSDTAFASANGEELYEWMAHHPEAAARYDAAIDSFTRHEAAALCSAFDFAMARVVVDVGGGRGSLLGAVLAANAHLRGVLFDLPHVIERVRPRLADAFGERVELIGGDFFAAVPAGDVVMCKHVLHNWNDERAAELLRRCAAAAGEDGRVLILETILSPDNRADMAAMLDLEMQVLLAGRVRRKPELRRLVSDAGLVLERFEALTAGTWLVVAARGQPTIRTVPP
jgi:hypothetical protein